MSAGLRIRWLQVRSLSRAPPPSLTSRTHSRENGGGTLVPLHHAPEAQWTSVGLRNRRLRVRVPSGAPSQARRGGLSRWVRSKETSRQVVTLSRAGASPVIHPSLWYRGRRVEIRACHARGSRFKSGRYRHSRESLAQPVEHLTLNQTVPGASPGGLTTSTCFPGETTWPTRNRPLTRGRDGAAIGPAF